MWEIAAKKQVLVFSYLIERMYWKKKKIEKGGWERVLFKVVTFVLKFP